MPPARSNARRAPRPAGAGRPSGRRATSSARRTVGASAGSSAARLASAAAARLEAELAPEREQALERLGLVAVARDDQRAGRAGRVSPEASASSAQKSAKRARAAQAELEQRALAELRLGDRREHARGDLPGAGIAGVEHDGAQAALGRAPRARQADRAATGDGDVKRTRGHCWTFPPYAGTTRIRFDGRRPAAALSARFAGSRSWACMVAAVMSPRERLATARLYLVCDARPLGWLRAALRGGVDLVQLRDKTLDDDGIVAAARAFRAAATRPARCSSSTTGPTWWRRATPTACTSARTTRRPRRRARRSGRTRIVGRSTHAPAQADAAQADPDVDYLAVGPGARDADQARPPGRGARVRRVRGAHA